jgi:hypothetical protein
MLPQVLDQMIAVGYLRGSRQRPLGCIRIGAGPIAADDFNFLVPFEPGQDRISRAIWQETSRRRLLTRAQGWTRSGSRSANTFRWQVGTRQKNLRTQSRRTTRRPPHGTSWTVR